MLRPLQRQRSDDSTTVESSQRYISERVSPPARGAALDSDGSAIAEPLNCHCQQQVKSKERAELQPAATPATPTTPTIPDSSFCWMVGVKPRHSLKLLCKQFPKITSYKNYLSSYATSSRSLSLSLCSWFLLAKGVHYGN